MALDKAGLIQAIKDFRNIDISNSPEDNDELAEALADAIDDYVKTGQVIVTSGSSAGTYPVV